HHSPLKLWRVVVNQPVSKLCLFRHGLLRRVSPACLSEARATFGEWCNQNFSLVDHRPATFLEPMHFFFWFDRKSAARSQMLHRRPPPRRSLWYGCPRGQLTFFALAAL